MSQRDKKMPPSTPEEKARVLRKFRALGKLVIENAYWLGQVDDSNIGDNVRKNIRIITMKKLNKKSSLTLREKSILCKSKENRTEEEKLILDIVIGGLKCFRRYPPHVKSQLAAVTYFVYFGPGRKIVKQDHVPSAMYFMLSGEAGVTVRHYDKFLQEWIEEDSGRITAGMMFGEVALLHGIVRLATITTITPCELLMIKKEDFDTVLKETVLKSWTEIQDIMHRFSYFKNWDMVTKRECSIMSRTKSFAPDETILGDNLGLPTYVYFVTKGTCCIIENLEVTVHDIKGIEKYQLRETTRQHDETNRTGDVAAIFDKYLREDVNTASAMSLTDWHKPEASKSGEVRFSPSTDGNVTSPTGSSLSSASKSTFKRTETHFIKVCELTKGACFNVGENFWRRRVVAVTPTQCLLIPRYWIQKYNIDNIWSRVQQFLNQHIPTTKQIFANFMCQRKFKQYRKRLVKDLLFEKKVANNNTIHNVPYSLRLTEGIDVD